MIGGGMRVRSILASIGIAAMLGSGIVASPAQAYYYNCRNIAVSWPIQEGSVDINTGMVDVTGRICARGDGYLDQGNTHLSVNIRTTSSGTFYMGASYWERGTSQVANELTQERWRFYGGYQSCFAAKVPLCSPEGYFYFDVVAWAPRIIGGSVPGLGRSAIIQNQNTWADVRWS